MPRKIKLPAAKSHARRAGVNVVVVVPALTQRQQGDPPYVDSVVCALEVLVAKFWQMAEEIEQQWNLENAKCSRQIYYCNFPAEHQADDHAESQADKEFVAFVDAVQETVNRILAKIRADCLDGNVDVIGHPAGICMQLAASWRMDVLLGVGILVMNPVNRCPPDGRSLKSEVASKNQNVFERLTAAKRAVRQQSVVTDRDAETVPEIRGNKD